MVATKSTIRHELIRASAGTGKTYELTSRFLQLLLLGARPDEILASTFTRKAAGEILGRVMLRLAQAAADQGGLARLRTALSDPNLSHDQCLELLASTVRQLHRLQVGTLDSFFIKLAGSRSLEMGLPPGWQIIEPHEDAAMRAAALQAVIDAEKPSDLLTLMHALTHGETTRSLEREVRDKVNSLYSAYGESNREAWHRVPRSRELDEVELRHAIAALQQARIPDKETWRNAHEKATTAANAQDWDNFLNAGLVKKIAAGASTFNKAQIPDHLLGAYQPLVNHIRAMRLNALANQTEATWQLLDKFDAHYRRLQSEYRGLRFEHVTRRLASYFAEFLQQPTETGVLFEALAFRLDGQFLHLLLDEFQDTSIAQWNVIRPFAQRITESTSQGSFFCVGDTKQAIYGWRGGVAEIFDTVTTQLREIHQRPLDTSWRSSPVIIDVVNRIFHHLCQHKNLDDLEGSVREWQQQFNTHQTAPSKQRLNGYVCLYVAPDKVDEDADSSADVTLRVAAEHVAQWRRKAPGFSIGVLTRTNDAIRRVIYELRELGIEASEEGGASLDDSAAVGLVLALVHLADHPGDKVARYHIATSPLADALRIFDDERSAQPHVSEEGKPQRTPLTTPEQFAWSWVAAGNLARRLRWQLMEHGYGKSVYAWARLITAHCNSRELRRLEKLIELAYQYDEVATARPGDFQAYVDVAKVTDPIAADVRVMTVHQAKGLEFDIVVLVQLDRKLVGQMPDLVVGRPSPAEPVDRICRYCNQEVQQLLPVDWQAMFRENRERLLAESLCVLYVGVTRAIHALQMIVACPKEHERSLPKTSAGLVRAALVGDARLQPGQIAYESGDAQWYKRPGTDVAPDDSPVLDAAPSTDVTMIDVRLAELSGPRWRGLERISPSGLEGGTFVQLGEHWTSGDMDRTAALARGTLIHAWFEQIQWLDAGKPNEVQLRQIASALPDLWLEPAELDRAIAEFDSMLDQPQIAACLHRRRYDAPVAALRSGGDARIELRVENERRFAVRLGDRLLTGSIDRLVTLWDSDRPVAADIIDYKTDLFPIDDAQSLQAKLDFYRPQVRAYHEAVRTMFKLDTDTIQCRLLFVQHNTLHDVVI